MPIISRNIKEVPDIDGIKYIKYTRITSIDSQGTFWLSFPEHLHEIALSVVHGWKESSQMIPYDNIKKLVHADTLEEADRQWKNLLYRCQDFIKTTNREKVILIKTAMNVSIMDESNEERKCILRKDDISFCDINPTIGLNYYVCYLIGDCLFDEENHYMSKTGHFNHHESSVAIVTYTEEREAFLHSLVKSIEKAALKINNFIEDIQKNPLSIDTIIRKALPGKNSD